MASQCGLTALGGQTPKSCSSLFDLKEVVQRQQLPPPWWQQQQVAARAVLLKQRSYLSGDGHQDDDGILKEFRGECPWLGRRDPIHTLLLEGLWVEPHLAGSPERLFVYSRHRGFLSLRGRRGRS
jgi:hypothetical protein